MHIEVLNYFFIYETCNKTKVNYYLSGTYDLAINEGGHTVLHVDTASYYGGDWASFTLDGIQQWIQESSRITQVVIYFGHKKLPPPPPLYFPSLTRYVNIYCSCTYFFIFPCYCLFPLYFLPNMYLYSPGFCIGTAAKVHAC